MGPWLGKVIKKTGKRRGIYESENESGVDQQTRRRLGISGTRHPGARPGQVRVKVEACGICHSDMLGDLLTPRDLANARPAIAEKLSWRIFMENLSPKDVLFPRRLLAGQRV
jgi:hypothetical protein